MTTDPTIPATVTTATTITAGPSRRPDNWRTLLLVGALIGFVVVAFAYAVLGPQWGTFCLLLAAYEGWTLVNAYREDTISEAVWFFAKRPLVPHILGLLVGIACASGYLGEPRTALRCYAIGMVGGHFFFSREETPMVVETTRTEVPNA